MFSLTDVSDGMNNSLGFGGGKASKTDVGGLERGEDVRGGSESLKGIRM
jgi:hypothetical protein